MPRKPTWMRSKLFTATTSCMAWPASRRRRPTWPRSPGAVTPSSLTAIPTGSPWAAGRVAGYAYASRYRPRPAYQYTVGNSVYVADDASGLGVGGRLLEDLIERCTELGFRQMMAVIGDTDNAPSINLHAKHGFQQVGEIRSVGFKFGRWVNSVIMQRPLGDGDDTLPPT